jgi:hypothetical protein
MYFLTVYPQRHGPGAIPQIQETDTQSR